MKKADGNSKPGGDPRGPIFLQREDGLGFKINYDRPAGYVALCIILAIILFGVFWGTGIIRL